jgi:hypothetical protein
MSIQDISVWPAVTPKRYRCHKCHSDDIRQHPENTQEWGCATCGSITSGPSIGFEIDPDALRGMNTLNDVNFGSQARDTDGTRRS